MYEKWVYKLVPLKLTLVRIPSKVSLCDRWMCIPALHSVAVCVKNKVIWTKPAYHTLAHHCHSYIPMSLFLLLQTRRWHAF